MALTVLWFLFFSAIGVIFENLHWMFSLLVQFQHWLLVLSFIAIGLLPFVNRPRILGLGMCLFAVLIHGWSVLPFWGNFILKTSNIENPSQSIDIFSANMNSQNEEKHRLLDYLQQNNPDIVFLLETNETWAIALKQLKSIYPYSKAIVAEGNFGMAVLSKEELEVKNVFVDRTNIIPAMFLRVKSSIGWLNLALLHSHPPISKYTTIMRDQYLDSLSRRIGELNSPLLVCGDLNTVPWSSIFRKFLKNSSLQFSGLINTWPTRSGFLKFPIDHCFSRGLKIVRYDRGPNIGSDHWPLLMRLAPETRSVSSR